MRIVAAYKNTIGMSEVAYRGAFAQELGIRAHGKGHIRTERL